MSESSSTIGGYAGLVTRAVALAIDAVAINVIALLAGAAVGLIGSVFGISDGLNVGTVLAGGAAWGLWCAAYFVAFWTFTGQTPGDRLLGIRVVGVNGKLGAGRAARRFVGLAVAMLPFGIGFLPVLFDDRRRGLHDRIAGTVVCWDEIPGHPELGIPESASAEDPARRSAPVARVVEDAYLDRG